MALQEDTTYRASRLQETELYLDLGTGTVRPEPGREHISVELGHNPALLLTPEDAFVIGKALIEHAVECGCDPDHGERD